VVSKVTKLRMEALNWRTRNDMNYISTARRRHGERHTFSDILLGGLAKDGGLYLSEYPQVSATSSRAGARCRMRISRSRSSRNSCDDVPADDLRAITRRTYTAAVYSNTRHGENVRHHAAEAARHRAGTALSLLELSNGPTLAFKDMAMQLLGNQFEHTLAKHGEH
jgi:threonine synthase